LAVPSAGPPEKCSAASGRFEIFNIDHGSQFTGNDFTGTLKRHRVTISMDGKGRCMDKIFVERSLMTLHGVGVIADESQILARYEPALAVKPRSARLMIGRIRIVEWGAPLPWTIAGVGHAGDRSYIPK